MTKFFKQKEVIFQFGIWGILITWYFVFGSQMLHKADVALNDTVKSHSFWLFPQAPKEKDIITIVAIDQESRQRLNLKWPWPRSVTAELIRKVSACAPNDYWPRYCFLRSIDAGRGRGAHYRVEVASPNHRGEHGTA